MSYLDEFERQERIDQLRSKLEDLKPGGRVPLYGAEQLVQASAWWIGHRQGPARAPGHAERITEHPKYGWQVRFGANAFLVEFAVMVCINLIDQFLDRVENGESASLRRLRSSMMYGVQRSVANFEGELYPGPYPLSDAYPNDMVFGTQSIDVTNFVDLLLAWVPVARLFESDRDEIEAMDLSFLDDLLDDLFEE